MWIKIIRIDIAAIMLANSCDKDGKISISDAFLAIQEATKFDMTVNVEHGAYYADTMEACTAGPIHFTEGIGFHYDGRKVLWL